MKVGVMVGTCVGIKVGVPAVPADGVLLGSFIVISTFSTSVSGAIMFVVVKLVSQSCMNSQSVSCMTVGASTGETDGVFVFALPQDGPSVMGM